MVLHGRRFIIVCNKKIGVKITFTPIFLLANYFFEYSKSPLHNLPSLCLYVIDVVGDNMRVTELSSVSYLPSLETINLSFLYPTSEYVPSDFKTIS